MPGAAQGLPRGTQRPSAHPQAPPPDLQGFPVGSGWKMQVRDRLRHLFFLHGDNSETPRPPNTHTQHVMAGGLGEGPEDEEERGESL